MKDVKERAMAIAVLLTGIRYAHGLSGLGCKISSWPQSSWLNDWDKPVSKTCGEQEGLYRHYSVHDDGREDRRYQMDCATVGGKGGKTYNLPITNWDEHYVRDCNDNADNNSSYLFGVDSYHDNGREDRRYTYKCREVGSGSYLSGKSNLYIQSKCSIKVAFLPPPPHVC